MREFGNIVFFYIDNQTLKRTIKINTEIFIYSFIGWKNSCNFAPEFSQL